MASESRLWDNAFTDETKQKLRKFKLGSSRANTPQAVILQKMLKREKFSETQLTDHLKEDQIDKDSLKIEPVEDGRVFTDLKEVAEELESKPRFIILSYPLKLSDGRLTNYYVLLTFLPTNCNEQLRMLFPGARDRLRDEAGVSKKPIALDGDAPEDDLEDIEEKLKE